MQLSSHLIPLLTQTACARRSQKSATSDVVILLLAHSKYTAALIQAGVVRLSCVFRQFSAQLTQAQRAFEFDGNMVNVTTIFHRLRQCALQYSLSPFLESALQESLFFSLSTPVKATCVRAISRPQHATVPRIFLYL